MLSIGTAVKRIRERLGKTQVEFASMLGCRQVTVWRWEKDAFKPNGFTLIQLIDWAEGEEKEPLAHQLALDLRTPIDIYDGTWREIAQSGAALVEAARAGQKMGAFLRDRLAAEEPMGQIDPSNWHAMLDQVLNSGQPEAVNMIQYALIVAEDRVRLKAEKSRKRKRWKSPSLAGSDGQTIPGVPPGK